MFEGKCSKVPQTEDIVKSISPLGRVAEVDEIGNSIAYLCSPAASYVNGIGLIIDAGLTLMLHLG
jgi:NAD(P)-dependent dehydrogenase (short-subunit alcohol dehydrogenase family)